MNRKKKIMIATLPALALIVLGSSVASAHMGAFRELTEEQRSALEEARQLRKEGSGDDAREVLKNAGLHMGVLQRLHKDQRKNHGRVSDAASSTPQIQHEAMRAALVENNFEAFTLAATGTPFAGMITQENFAKLVQAHALREAGDTAGARALLKDLGFPGVGHGMRFMHGMQGKWSETNGGHHFGNRN